MADSDPKSWKTLNKDLERISMLEQAATLVSRPLVAPEIGLAFMVLVGLVVASFTGIAAPAAIVVAVLLVLGLLSALAAARRVLAIDPIEATTGGGNR